MKRMAVLKYNPLNSLYTVNEDNYFFSVDIYTKQFSDKHFL